MALPRFSRSKTSSMDTVSVRNTIIKHAASNKTSIKEIFPYQQRLFLSSNFEIRITDSLLFTVPQKAGTSPSANPLMIQ